MARIPPLADERSQLPDYLSGIFRQWLTADTREDRDAARNKLKASNISVYSLPNPHLATVDTHGPCKVYDANGMEWKRMLWVDTKTGEGDQFDEKERRVAQRVVLPSPVLLVPIKGSDDR